MEEYEVEEKEQSFLQKGWGFLKVRKLWWMTPMILILLLFLLSFLAGRGISLESIYAPI